MFAKRDTSNLVKEFMLNMFAQRAIEIYAAPKKLKFKQ